MTESLDRKARVYLDCQACDEAYLRRNITFVDYVRARQQADVHLLGTIQRTGSGGLSYRLRFIGQKAFAGTRFALGYDASPTHTRDQRREGLAERIRVGLGSFVGRTPVKNQIALAYEGGTEENTTQSPEEEIFSAAASWRTIIN